MMGEEAKIRGGDVGSGIRIARSQPTIDVCLNVADNAKRKVHGFSIVQSQHTLLSYCIVNCSYH